MIRRIMDMRYDYRDNTQLSAHFNVQEFKCKCGREHDILINPELIVNLEKLYKIGRAHV